MQSTYENLSRDQLIGFYEKMFLIRNTEERISELYYGAQIPGFVHLSIGQEPGPHNALGTVKIVFPNKFSVYLHDTPSHSLFQKTKRQA
jgi:murein L,D-transpeptidase YcbB/YkuD